jgi:hypothetical protein
MQQLQHMVHQEGSDRTLLFQFSGLFDDKSHSCTTYLKVLYSYNVSNSESVIGVSSFEGHGSSRSQWVTMTNAQKHSAMHSSEVVNQTLRWSASHFLHTSSYLIVNSRLQTPLKADFLTGREILCKLRLSISSFRVGIGARVTRKFSAFLEFLMWCVSLWLLTRCW